LFIILVLLFFFLLLRRQPTSTLFPYTTLFRSCSGTLPRATRCIARDSSHICRNACLRSGTVDRYRTRMSSRQTGVSADVRAVARDRKSTRLNSSHSQISYAVFCLKKKKKKK